jgi:serine phosphatase RsbU (regulator of sigma subunit)
LTDYIEIQTLQQLQDRFVAVAQVPIRIWSMDTQAVTKESPLRRRRRAGAAPAGAAEEQQAIIDIAGEALARIVMTADSGDGADRPDNWRQDILQLMAGVIGGLYHRQKQLRTRIEQLATLYTLTGVFTGQRDLPSLMDVVAKTVVDVLKAKACSIRLLNEERTELVIKAVANLSPAYLNKGPILVSASVIDQEAISTGRPVYIADERNDARVLYPKEARREGIVSALCAPMVYRGLPEGVLRVYMAKKHTFDWFEESLLTAIAAQAAAAIVSARLHQEALRAAEVDKALAMAADVQRQMIPDGPPCCGGLDIGAVYVPCYALGGDFYDFIPLPQDNLGIAICDVAGKGVRASLLMASIRASLRAHVPHVYDMSDVIAHVNADLYEGARAGDFATMFYGVMDMRRRRFTYVNAGHLPPLLMRKGQAYRLSTGGGLLGVNPAGTWSRGVLAFEPGDTIIAYTDGLSEALNFEDVPFGIDRVERAAAVAIERGQRAEEIAQHLLWEMRRFTGLQTRSDDLTIVAAKVL